VLASGDHQGPCFIGSGGSSGAPLILRGAPGSERPRIVYGGNSSNMMDLDADWITVRGLEYTLSVPKTLSASSKASAMPAFIGRTVAIPLVDAARVAPGRRCRVSVL
jgi:hypothetical protein